MLRDNFPNTKIEANKYNGFLNHINQFCIIFNFDKDLKTTLETINKFLNTNGYESINLNQIDEVFSFENELLSLSKHGYNEELVLFINRENPISELDGVIESLLEFRDQREWEQFHNSKDLSLAISIEAGELLELFLWKDNEGFNKDKLEEELADIFCYGLLLAEKNNLNVIDIIKKKIAKNDEKYPVDKAKGTAKKYNEL
jgi:NTP pyrophosphatase (non-canonical NTP hydrolase)